MAVPGGWETNWSEFRGNVFLQTQDTALAAGLNAAEMSGEILGRLVRLADLAQQRQSDETIATAIREAYDEGGHDFLNALIQLVGSTNTRFKDDVVALGITAGIDERSPGSHGTVPGRAAHWLLGSQELARWLRRVFEGEREIPDENLPDVVRALSRATWPAYNRMRRAKLGGHAAEQKLAVLCSDLGIPFEPRVKIERPMSGDVRPAGQSVDLVFPDEARPRVAVIAAIHVSAPGQYGRDKAKAIAGARERLRTLNPICRILLLIDGLGLVGYQKLLGEMFEHADEFCQLGTLWKGAVVAKRHLNMDPLRLWIPEAQRVTCARFLSRHADMVELLEDRPDGGVVGGEGVFAT